MEDKIIAAPSRVLKWGNERNPALQPFLPYDILKRVCNFRHGKNEKGMLQPMKNFKKPSPLLGAFLALAVLVLLLVIYTVSKPVPMVGTKNISIDVVYQDGSLDHYKVSTEAHFLLEAVEAIPELKISGTTTEQYGLMVYEVNGKEADYEKNGAYWSLLLNGEPCNYGISSQPIKDEEHYTLQYTAAGGQE